MLALFKSSAAEASFGCAGCAKSACVCLCLIEPSVTAATDTTLGSATGVVVCNRHANITAPHATSRLAASERINGRWLRRFGSIAIRASIDGQRSRAGSIAPPSLRISLRHSNSTHDSSPSVRLQQAAGAMQLCLRRADGHAELVRYFFMFPAFDVVQHEHGARARRQFRNGPFQVAPFGRAERHLAAGVISSMSAVDRVPPPGVRAIPSARYSRPTGTAMSKTRSPGGNSTASARRARTPLGSIPRRGTVHANQRSIVPYTARRGCGTDARTHAFRRRRAPHELVVTQDLSIRIEQGHSR